MDKPPKHGWSKPRVDLFFAAHPDWSPEVPSFVPEGWDEPVADALTQLLDFESASGVRIRIAQIKEKFGRLRIYVKVSEDSLGPLEIVRSTPASTRLRSSATPGSVRASAHAVVDAAEERAEQCCIRCGAPATRREGFYRLCAKHRRRTRTREPE